jgi:Fe-S cluster biogenesis protein NfuA
MNSSGSNSKTSEFQNRIARIEELIRAIDAMPDEMARAQTRELVQTLLDLHGNGLNRALEIVFDSSDGQALINKLASDDLVSKLLLLHGLHPLDLETRVRQAIDEVKPRLGLHGGSVQLVEVTPDGAVRLQLEGNCEGCPSSRLTLKFSIEEAIYAAAPDITALEVNGLVEEHAPPAANPKFTECPTVEGNGQIPITGGRP